MVKYRVMMKGKQAIISIDSNGKTPAFIEISGDAVVVKRLEREMPNFYGMYGHKLGSEMVLPYDLHYALTNNSYMFDELSLAEGIVTNDIPSPLPDDAPRDAVT